MRHLTLETWPQFGSVRENDTDWDQGHPCFHPEIAVGVDDFFADAQGVSNNQRLHVSCVASGRSTALKIGPRTNMHQAERIREALSKIDSLRQSARCSTELAASVSDVKALQSRRFAGTYADLIADERYNSATRFFLQELYGDRDFTTRDTQFFRVAGTLERMLPRQATETAALLAQLHFLSEDLDYCMARTSLSFSLSIGDIDLATTHYVQAWRRVGRRKDRLMQLQMVLSLGHALVRLTKTPGLRLLLRMMRAPANAAGLGSLQHFLEAGFDTFSSMNAWPGNADYFLATIEKRESELIRNVV